MKDLSSSSGQPENFRSHNYYKFESVEIAREVESGVHRILSDLGLRVTDKREFFDYAKRKLFLRDVVMEVADKLEVKTLSNFNLQKSVIEDFGLLIPCRYFLLNSEEVFDDYCHWVIAATSTAYSILGMDLAYDNFGPLAINANKPNYDFRNYLRDFDTEPFLLARMKFTADENAETLYRKLSAELKDKIDDYFSYNKEWREDLIL